jgi:hypothetical protein
MNFWTLFFDRAGDAADQSAAAYRHNDSFQIWHLFQKFEANGALPGDHRVVIERVQEDQSLRIATPPCFVHRFVEIVAE